MSTAAEACAYVTVMVEMVLANMLPLSLNCTVCATTVGTIVKVLLVPEGISQYEIRLALVLQTNPPGPCTALLEMKIRDPEVLDKVNELSLTEVGEAVVPLHPTLVAAEAG